MKCWKSNLQSEFCKYLLPTFARKNSNNFANGNDNNDDGIGVENDDFEQDANFFAEKNRAKRGTLHEFEWGVTFSNQKSYQFCRKMTKKKDQIFHTKNPILVHPRVFATQP